MSATLRHQSACGPSDLSDNTPSRLRGRLLDSTRPTTTCAKMSTTTGRDSTKSAAQEPVNQPATTAVLTTNELLTQILSDVPCEPRADLRRVCKTWRDVISKIGFQVSPIEVCRGYAEKPMHHDTFSLPCYPASMKLKINLAAGQLGIHTSSSKRLRPGQPSPPDDDNRVDLTLYSKFTTSDQLAKLGLKGHEFVTRPPITCAFLDFDYYNFRVVPSRAIELQVPEGIRIRDLIQGWTKLRASLLPHKGGSKSLLGAVHKVRFVACAQGEYDRPYDSSLRVIQKGSARSRTRMQP